MDRHSKRTVRPSHGPEKSDAETSDDARYVLTEHFSFDTGESTFEWQSPRAKNTDTERIEAFLENVTHQAWRGASETKAGSAPPRGTTLHLALRLISDPKTWDREDQDAFLDGLGRIVRNAVVAGRVAPEPLECPGQFRLAEFLTAEDRQEQTGRPFGSRQQHAQTSKHVPPPTRVPAETLPSPASQPNHERFQALERELARVQAPIIEQFHEFLKQLAGTTPETYEQAVETINAIKRFARLAGRQLLYEGEPVAVHCTKPRGYKRASIQARVSIAGKEKAVYVGLQIPSLTSRTLS